MRLAILGHGGVTRALLPILERDGRFEVAGIHTRSQPAAGTVEAFLDGARAETLVELTTLNPWTGEPAISHIRAAFARGMHVVTANKGPIAVAYHELEAAARERGVTFRFESTVMDGTPVFNQFRNNAPGVKVLGFTGVLNSTSNVVIQAMESGQSFEQGLAVAREMGIAEADASYDTEGWDSAAKTAALANVLMDARTSPQRVHREGIGHVTNQQVAALVQAGRTIRLLGRARMVDGRLDLSVRAEILQRSDVLASLQGTSNLIFFETDWLGTFGIFSIHPGVVQTAYGVYIDLVDVLTGQGRG